MTTIALTVTKRPAGSTTSSNGWPSIRSAGTIGIGHTRWATHGAPTDVNAHPHLGGDGALAVVHNGVIENFQPLKQRLAERGLQFPLGHRHRGHRPPDRQLPEAAAAGRPTWRRRTTEPLVAAVQAALAQLQGTYGLAILFRDWPDVLIAARLGSPLVVGVGDGEHFVASDASPLAGYTDKIVYLADHELAVLTADSLRVIHRDQGHVDHSVHVLDLEAGDIDTGRLSRTTCSRRSSSSPSRSKTPCAAGSTATRPRPSSAA